MSNPGIRMLALSPPCLTAVNREIYRFLAKNRGFTMHLVMPRRSKVGSDWRVCEDTSTEPIETSLLDVTGIHPNLHRFQGIEKLVEGWKPTHILIDNDPATMMVHQVVRSIQRVSSARPKVWAQTAVNQMPDAFHDLRLGIREFKLNLVAGPLITSWLRNSVRPHLDRVLTISKDGSRVMEELGFRGRVTQIPLGFDRRLFHPESPEFIASTRSRLGLTHPTIAYFGRLVHSKGLHVLLRALVSVMDLPWQFLIDRFSAYQTPYAASIKQQIETLGLTERVVFFDATHSEMPVYMNAADFVVLPSVTTPKWKEQYGRVIPEAMACGKIVIGSRSGAIPEIIGDAGYTFPEGDFNALGGLIRKLLIEAPESLEQTRKAAVRRSHDYYSVDRQAEILAQLATIGESGNEQLTRNSSPT